MRRSATTFVATVAAATAAVSTIAPTSARACSVCGCGDPLVDVASSAPLSGQWSLSLRAEYLTASARSDEDPALTEKLAQTTIDASVVYSPTDRINLVLTAPVVGKDWRLRGSPSQAERSHRYGLGDLDFGLRYFVWRRTDLDALSRQNLAVFAGTSLPTGPDATKVNGDRIDQHAQIGTGAFGPYAGVLYAFHKDPWNTFASVSGRIHTTNKYGYRYAPALLWSARGELRPWEFLAFELGVDGRYNGHDTADGERQVNTGGLVVALSPALMARIYDTLWLHLRVQVPVITKLNGVQSVGPTYEGILQYTFH